MALNLYNTLTKKVEPFVPLTDTVGLYTCGPTVYNYAHIGNFRAYITGDIVKRTLSYAGFPVKHIMNITDVDDKMIRDSIAAGKGLLEYGQFYTEEFKKDLARLNIIPPKEYTKATDYIPQMVALIETLISKGHAYKSDDGSVYFDVRSDKNYGQLSPVAISEKKENAAGRIIKDEYEKDNASDFALWKAWDENDGDVFWETSLGKGRPGWHVECSAMAMDHLGESFDIHTGGIDLVFPHHENEIAQSECATGKKFVNYWIHNEWVMVEGKKMAKSAGNFTTLQTVIEKGINPLAFRLWVLMAHYRTPSNFTWDALEGAQTALKRLNAHFLELGTETGLVNSQYRIRFAESLFEDFDTPAALVVFWEAVKDTTLSNAEKRATLLDMDTVLGFGLKDLTEDIIPDEIMTLVAEREEVRTNKDWKRSDELRDVILEKGYQVKDTDHGPKVTKL